MRRRELAQRGEALRRAAEFSTWLASGHIPSVTPTLMRLGPGEACLAEITAHLSLFHGRDAVSYVQSRRARSVLWWLLFWPVAVAALVRNSLRRNKAERTAMPQWRPPRPVPLVATNRRLIVVQDGVCVSLWYDAIAQVVPELEQLSLRLMAYDGAPHRLSGPSVPWLAVLLVRLLYGEQLWVPPPDKPVPPPRGPAPRLEGSTPR